jgi:hypothetical protein
MGRTDSSLRFTRVCIIVKRGNNYISFNDQQIAMIGKSGSSAIAKAIHISLSNVDEMSEEQLNSNRPGFQHLVRSTQDPHCPIIPVRDPVERFISACAQEDRTPSQEISRIERGRYSFHTKQTSSYLVAGARLYKFPEHIKEIAHDLGLNSIPSVNDGASNNSPKPVLTSDELKRVEELYSDDLHLFNSILSAGQIYY